MRRLAIVTALAGLPIALAPTASADMVPAEAPPDPAERGGKAAANGMCPGDRYGSGLKVITNGKALHEDYYDASPELINLYYGDTFSGYFDVHTNKHGNKWYRVQVSNIQRDWCGWVYEGWVDYT